MNFTFEEEMVLEEYNYKVTLVNGKEVATKRIGFTFHKIEKLGENEYEMAVVFPAQDTGEAKIWTTSLFASLRYIGGLENDLVRRFNINNPWWH